MELNLASTCDVLVLGSGIAGISAALTAAESGASVILVCKGRLFSGSSFYPGTWGLGLVGPADEADEADLISTIEDVGCGMADDALVRALVKGIHPAIEKVRSMGVRLRKAGKGGQQEYIPCFDHKHRDWNGIEFDSAREIFSQRLEELGVTILSGRETLELVRADGRVCGAVITDGAELHYLGCKALVLATGGYACFVTTFAPPTWRGWGRHWLWRPAAGWSIWSLCRSCLAICRRRIRPFLTKRHFDSPICAVRTGPHCWRGKRLRCWNCALPTAPSQRVCPPRR